MGVTAAISMVALGAVVSALGQLEAGDEAKHLYERNAQIGEYQAQDALRRGKTDETQARRQTEQVIGAQRTRLAAQGVDVNRGSALDVQADAAYLGELDALTIRNNAAKEAWGFRTQADDFRAKGKIAKREGEFGAFRTILGAGRSLLLSKYGAFTTTTPLIGDE